MKGSAALSTATVRATTAASATRPDRFHLTGPTRQVDCRTHAVRRDLADIGLAGTLFAPHYATPLMLNCRTTAVAMRDGPSDTARAVSQLLWGEAMAVLDISGGWAWGYSAHDRYVGYVEADALGPPATTSHVVAALLAPLFTAPDIKAPVVRTLPIGARLAGALSGDWLAIDDGFVHRRHVGAAGAAADPVEVAERLIGLPYLWGGRGAGGIDCSGLVQLALGLAGIAAPRDSDQQQALGRDVTGEARRGDLVFLPGHVGMMRDATHLLHANAHWMAVVAEPLLDVLARTTDGAGGIVARRRLA